MNKKGQTHYHGHYTGNIPFGIWWLVVSLACIGLGLLIDQLGVLAFIGFVLLLLEIGFFVITILMEIDKNGY